MNVDISFFREKGHVKIAKGAGGSQRRADG